MIRGIYDEKDEAEEWRVVQRFETKEDAEAFTKRHISKVCTNPDFAFCHHVYTTLCDWSQVWFRGCYIHHCCPRVPSLTLVL